MSLAQRNTDTFWRKKCSKKRGEKKKKKKKTEQIRPYHITTHWEGEGVWVLKNNKGYLKDEKECLYAMHNLNERRRLSNNE